MFLLVAKLWTRKERLGLSSPSSAREPTGDSGEVTPVLSDLLDNKASLAYFYMDNNVPLVHKIHIFPKKGVSAI